jgi:hypothetical protein
MYAVSKFRFNSQRRRDVKKNEWKKLAKEYQALLILFVKRDGFGIEERLLAEHAIAAFPKKGKKTPIQEATEEGAKELGHKTIKRKEANAELKDQNSPYRIKKEKPPGPAGDMYYLIDAKTKKRIKTSHFGSVENALNYAIAKTDDTK